MAVPKNFNQTVNFNNRVESLNDLIYHSIRYDYTLTGKKLEGFNIDTEITGFKEITALDEEQAKAKIKNWFDVLIKHEILESYNIKLTETKNFHEILKDKNILETLKYKNPQ